MAQTMMMPNVYNIHRLKLKYFLFKNRRHIYHNVSRYRGSNRQSCVCYREEDSSGMVRMSSSYANSLSHDIRPLRELLISRYPSATRTPCLTISVRYANSLSAVMRTVLCYAKDLHIPYDRLCHCVIPCSRIPSKCFFAPYPLFPRKAYISSSTGY